MSISDMGKILDLYLELYPVIVETHYTPQKYDIVSPHYSYGTKSMSLNQNVKVLVHRSKEKV